MASETQLMLARGVREACIRAWREGYEAAGMSGLCAEGALEAALSAVQELDLDVVVNRLIESADKDD